MLWHDSWDHYLPMADLEGLDTTQVHVKHTNLREAVLHSLAMTKDHKGSIVPILKAFHDRGTDKVVIFLPKANGDLIDITPKVTKAELLSMMAQAILAVHMARAIVRSDTPLHELLGPDSHGSMLFLVHGDVKPDNFLVFGNRVRICDFGAAFTTPKYKLPIISTLCYAAPERYCARTYEITNGQWCVSNLQSMDLFSLAASLFTYLTAELFRNLRPGVRRWEDLLPHEKTLFEFGQDCDPDTAYVFKHHFEPGVARKLLRCLDSIPLMRSKAYELIVSDVHSDQGF
jgi:serine/threonine protein kinase